MMNIQQSGTEYYAGKAAKSKKRLTKLKEDIMGEMADLGGAGLYDESIEYLEDELEEMEMEEEKIKMAPAKSFMASQGQVKARLSEMAVKKRIESKKKKK